MSGSRYYDWSGNEIGPLDWARVESEQGKVVIRALLGVAFLPPAEFYRRAALLADVSK